MISIVRADEQKAAMLKRRFDNIITYLRHQITNASSESLNAKIQWVKYTARGFRNKHNFIRAIYFHCGKGAAGKAVPLIPAVVEELRDISHPVGALTG